MPLIDIASLLGGRRIKMGILILRKTIFDAHDLITQQPPQQLGSQ